MNARHVTQEELERYVVDALEPVEAAALEAHVAACPRCAGALAAEARLEVALHEVLPPARAIEAVAPAPSRAVRAGGLPRPAPWVLMAAAAALVLVCLPHAGRGPLPLPSGRELPGLIDGDPSALLSAARAPVLPAAAGDEGTLLCALSPASRALCLASQGPSCGPQPADESAP
ncbi:MAG: zf-HC2 domain-containing protein [Polyangia bacterium]